ncbi:hypothetical protein K8I85_03045 [bacterium]|nr:hypothetical protein [bacterium]
MALPLPPRIRDALVVLAGIAFALLLAEGSLRLFASRYLGLHDHPTMVTHDRFINHDRIGQYDELLGWKLQPDTVGENRGREFRHEIRTNSRGYRDDEFRTARRDGEKRVALLGDSFGMGWGVPRDAMLATLLEDECDATDVVNLSVAGYGTTQEVLTYETEATRYSPDFAVLLFVIGNDLNDNIHVSRRYRKPFFRPDGDGITLSGVPVPYTVIESRKVPMAPSRFPVHDWLDNHSALYSVVFERLSTLPSLRSAWEGSGLVPRQVAVFGREEIDILRKTYPPELRMGWWVTEKILLRFRDSACSNGATPIVVIVPSHLQVYPEIWDEAVRGMRLDESGFDLARPNRILSDFCEHEGIAVLDLLPVLREAAPRSLPLYFRTDPHWTEEGHRIAAGALAAFLEAGEFDRCGPGR